MESPLSAHSAAPIIGVGVGLWPGSCYRLLESGAHRARDQPGFPYLTGAVMKWIAIALIVALVIFFVLPRLRSGRGFRRGL